MLIYIVSAFLIFTGIALFFLQLLFEVTLFLYSGGMGFFLFFVGVYLLSCKSNDKEREIKRKDLGDFPGSGPYGGGDGG